MFKKSFRPFRFYPTFRLISTTLLILIVQSVFAERKPVAVGMLGGITSASFWGSDIKEFDFNLWPTVGMNLTFHLPVFLGLETDVLYVKKSGSIRTYPVDALTGNSRIAVNSINLQSFEFPLLLKITAPTESEVMPIFFGGRSLAYFFSKETFSEYVDNSSNGLLAFNQAPIYIDKANIPDLDWSLCLGAGVEWGLGSFQLRFNFGKNSIDKTGSYDVKTVVIGLMGGFIF